MMITYLKNMEGGSRLKRTADSASEQKSSKKPKVIQEQESAELEEEAAADYKKEKEDLRMWLTVVPDEEETVDPEILSTKIGLLLAGNYMKIMEFTHCLWMLEAEADSTMAFELLKFIKSQLED
ncbi:hypothetical protein Tco_0527054 [Tanacetum coccineum]